MLAAIVLISFSGLVVFGVADDSPIITINYNYPGKNSYYDITILIDGEDSGTYPGWCADSGVYVDDQGYPAILVSSCGLELEGVEAYDNDENWRAINYLINEWNSGSYSGATWVDIQQVIWYYADFGSYDPFTTPTPPYNFDSSKVQEIINDVKDNWESYTGPPCSIIIVHDENAWDNQLLFFMIPEIPLGTIGAGLTMLSAFIVKRKRTRKQ